MGKAIEIGYSTGVSWSMQRHNQCGQMGSPGRLLPWGLAEVLTLESRKDDQ